MSTTDEQVQERTGDYQRFLDEQAAYVESLLRAAGEGEYGAVAIANAIRVAGTEIAAQIKTSAFVIRKGKP